MFSSDIFLNQICFSVHIIAQINYPPLSENDNNLLHSIQNAVVKMICLPCTHGESLHWFIPLRPINIQFFCVCFQVFHVCICPFLLIIPSFVLWNADSSPHIVSLVLSASEILLVMLESSLLFLFLKNVVHHKAGFLCVLQTYLFYITLIKAVLESPLA